MRVLWVTVRYHHFCQGEPIEDSALLAVVVVGYVIEDDAFAVVEADVEVPILPGNLAVVDCKGDSGRLGDVERF